MSGWDRENCNSNGMHKEANKMITCHNYSLLTHFVTAKHELPQTKYKSRMNFRMKQIGATQSKGQTNSEEMDTEM